MGVVIPVVFIGVLYGVWKWLDSLQIPNGGHGSRRYYDQRRSC